jgi:Protein of unknown function (DUF3662)/Inner membrane component of T3SS, cytoplasmic domain
MPGPFAALERFFERVLERPAARLFRTTLQPVQLQRRLERTMDGERRLGADRTYVPNRYRVSLNSNDVEAFRSYQSTLEGELEEALLARARSRRYTLVERPRVTIEASDSVAPGEIRVQAEVLDPLLLRPAPAGFRRVDAGDGEDRARLDQTAVFELPPISTPSVVLVVRDARGREWELAVRGGVVRMGRGPDNDLVLSDEQVSRHHGQLVARQGALVYRDLDSTNGSFVNGERVTEIAIGPGDVLQVGRSQVRVDAGD